MKNESSHNSCFYLLNKPLGIPSRKSVLDKLKLSQKNKFGIEGILDPFAEGLLIIGTGYYTRFFPLFQSSKKVYSGTIHLGIATDTMDVNGSVVFEKKVPQLDNRKISEAMKQLTGEINQYPPLYSNVKLDGISLRRHIREFGKNPSHLKEQIRPRKVNIYQFDLLGFSDSFISFRAEVSTGTYLRSLAMDLAHLLDTVGYLKSLKRERIGMLHLDMTDPAKLHCYQAFSFLNDKPFIQLNREQIRKLFFGQKIILDYPNQKKMIFIDNKKKILGFGDIENSEVIYRRMIPQDQVNYTHLQ